jgi:hypothetical protein
MKVIHTVLSCAIVIFGCMLLVAANPLFADSMRPEGKRITAQFQSPMFQGNRLDWCRSWAKDCGKGAADAWCRNKGFEAASSNIQIDENIGKSSPTKIISTGQVCNQDFCDGFKLIECYKLWCPAGSKDKCCYGKEC